MENPISIKLTLSATAADVFDYPNLNQGYRHIALQNVGASDAIFSMDGFVTECFRVAPNGSLALDDIILLRKLQAKDDGTGNTLYANTW